MTTTTDCSPLHLVTRDFNYFILDRSQILYLKHIHCQPTLVDDSEVDEEMRGKVNIVPRQHQLELFWKSPENGSLVFRCEEWKTASDVHKYIAALFGPDAKPSPPESKVGRAPLITKCP